MNLFGFSSSGKPKQEGFYSELETPVTKEDYEKLSQKKLDEFLKLIAEPGWDPVSFNETGNEDIKVFAKVSADSHIHSQQASAILNASPQVVLEMAFCTDYSIVKQFDQDLLSSKVIEKLNENTVCYLSSHYCPFPISTREFVALRFKKIADNGVCYCWGTSINRLETPQTSGHVRGIISVSGWIIEPIKDKPNSCRVRRMFRIDPKGSIPAMVVNMYRTKAGTQLVAVRNYLKNKH